MLAACGPSDTGTAIQRVAFLPWENLTGDSSLDWIAAAGPTIVSAQLAGAGRTVPLAVATMREAYLGNASQVVHAYFDRRGGQTHLEVSIEDLSTHRMRDTLALDGDILQTSAAMARKFDPMPGAFSTANLEAVEVWGKGQNAAAVKLDPGFSAAWLAWSQQQVAASKNEEALAIVNQALGQPNLASPIDRARLQVLSATLRRDEGARDEAWLELVRLLPNDAALARQLADRFQNGRRFDSAVRLYREVIRLDPNEAGAYNQLGYSLFFSGDLPAALQAFQEYGEHPGQEANAFDSQGEVSFMGGQFADAERYFLQAHAKDATLLQGGDLLKAAYARWLARDFKQADQHFDEYAKFRRGQGDQLLDWRRGVWLFATGRRPEAEAMLQAARGPAAQIARAQLQVWEQPNALPSDPALLRTAVDSTPPFSDGFARTLYARALVQAGQREQAKEWVKLYPLPDAGPDGPDVLQRSFTFPFYLELRRQLIP